LGNSDDDEIKEIVGEKRGSFEQETQSTKTTTTNVMELNKHTLDEHDRMSLTSPTNDNENSEFYNRHKSESTKAWIFATEKACSNFEKREAEMRRDEEQGPVVEKKGSREKFQNLLEKILCIQFCRLMIKKISCFCLRKK